MSNFSLVGLSQEAVDYLESGEDVCFGKSFAAGSTECIRCRAPVVHEGQVLLMKDLCALRCRGVSTRPPLKRLTHQEVLARVERGIPLREIFFEILGDLPPKVAGGAARQLLMDRLLWLKTKGLEVGPVPKMKEMLDPTLNGEVDVHHL